MLKTIFEHQVKFAVRGGGHTINGAAANIDDSVAINLRSLSQVSVDQTTGIVSIGGGAK